MNYRFEERKVMQTFVTLIIVYIIFVITMTLKELYKYSQDKTRNNQIHILKYIEKQVQEHKKKLKKEKIK